MRVSFLKHLLAAVSGLNRPSRIVILGSSSLLAQQPDLGEPGQPLEITLDADLLLEPIDESAAGMLKEAVGKDSLFEQRHGYYADILRPDIVKTLPAGWESRLVPVPGYNNVFALDPYDLALVKLLLGRPKDLDLLRALLRMGLLDPIRIRQRYAETPLDERQLFDAGRNLTLLLRELGME